MKKMLSLIVLITGICLSSFSQIRNSLQAEPFKNFSSNRNMERFSLGKSTIKGALNTPLQEKNFSFPKFMEKNPSCYQNQKECINNNESFDPMPCLKPQGEFPMPVYKPDSTIRFSLLIKRYEKGRAFN